MQNLLAETQQLNEELQVQQEELRTANEELEEQSRVLKESQANLENQQAELEQTNEQLSEVALSLDHKNAALNQAQTLLALCTPADLHDATLHLAHGGLPNGQAGSSLPIGDAVPAYRDDHRWMWSAKAVSMPTCA